MCYSLTGQAAWQVNSHTAQNALPHLQPLVVRKENGLVKEATSKGFTHLSTRVQANSGYLEGTDIMATQKGFVKLCFLTSKTHQTRQVFMLPSAQKKRHLPDHPHNFLLFCSPRSRPSSLAQLPPASQRQEAQASPAELLLICKPQNSSSRLLSAGGRRGRALFPFLTFILTRFAEEKKSRFKYQVQHSPFPT